MKKAPARIATPRKARASASDIDNLVAYLNEAIKRVEDRETLFYLHEKEVGGRVERMEREYRGHVRYGCSECCRCESGFGCGTSLYQRLRWLLTGRMDKSNE